MRARGKLDEALPLLREPRISLSSVTATSGMLYLDLARALERIALRASADDAVTDANLRLLCAAPGVDRYNLNVQLSVKPQRLTEFLEIIEAQRHQPLQLTQQVQGHC